MNYSYIVVISGGLGELAQYIVNDLLIHGCTVCSLDINTSKEDLKNKNYHEFRCDITNEEDVVSTIKKIYDIFGNIHILINNAGLHINKKFVEIKYEEIVQLMNVNIIGTFLLTSEVIKYMLKQNRGKIINISSSAPFDCVPNTSIYSMSKASMNCMTQCLVKELKGTNISVNAICPTVIHTEVVNKNCNRISKESGMDKETILKNYCENLNLEKRLLEPSEICAAVRFLISDIDNSVNGMLLPVNCGSTLR